MSGCKVYRINFLEIVLECKCIIILTIIALPSDLILIISNLLTITNPPQFMPTKIPFTKTKYLNSITKHRLIFDKINNV